MVPLTWSQAAELAETIWNEAEALDANLDARLIPASAILRSLLERCEWLKEALRERRKIVRGKQQADTVSGLVTPLRTYAQQLDLLHQRVQEMEDEANGLTVRHKERIFARANKLFNAWRRLDPVLRGFAQAAKTFDLRDDRSSTRLEVHAEIRRRDRSA
ncbi:hypothetical protein [Nonomuraea cavernae]|uniref:Uncharacterized protein n=1 Tax=Nonomuraea cavernae TaxID=2045107 RepID=A0A917Z0L7_9ACTN|nr:hypothetical protein [Nonomuraea cavernae]MCA2186291.1 hypothetical protein [Nonomuraea cavernae]GGO69630.1 hypothetical protein GCM10012289_31180 [Nonomuraea cavernae]